MLVDLSLDGSRVLIAGAGRVGLRKARNILSESRNVTIASDHFTPESRRLERAGARLVKSELGNDRVLRKLVSSADVVIAATNDLALNRKIAHVARTLHVMIGSVDDPAVSDFNFPAVRAVGAIRVGVSTGGRSPAMAMLICKRLARTITHEDRLRVDLMNHARNRAREVLPTPAARKAAVYRVLRDRKVEELIREGRLTRRRPRPKQS